MKRLWNFSSRFQHHLSITIVLKVDEHFPVQLLFQHPHQVRHFSVEMITLVGIYLISSIYTHAFIPISSPCSTYRYIFVFYFLWSMHVIKCQGAALNPPTPFDLLDNSKYFFCALCRHWVVFYMICPIVSYLGKFYTYWCLLQVGSCSCFYYFLLLFLKSSYFILYFPWSWQDPRCDLQSSWTTATLPRNCGTQCMV